MRGEPYLIFCIDDDPESSGLLEEYIADAVKGCQVMSFVNPEGAIKNMYHNPDLIILDYSLQTTTGLEVLKKIKNKSIETTVLMLSNYTDPEVKNATLEYGATDFFAKDDDGYDNIIKYIKRNAHKSASIWNKLTSLFR